MEEKKDLRTLEEIDKYQQPLRLFANTTNDRQILDFYKSIAPPETEIEKAMRQESGVPDIDMQISSLSNIGLIDTNLISDGYHTFGELYEHRIALYIALCRELADTGRVPVWKSEKHSDGSIYPGWFVLGLFSKPGYQITYHLPTSRWDECSFAKVVDQAPEFDDHTSADVLERLKSL